MRSTGDLGRAFEAVGAVPTSMTASEVYQAMEPGVIDSAAFAQHAHLSFGAISRLDRALEHLERAMAFISGLGAFALMGLAVVSVGGLSVLAARRGVKGLRSAREPFSRVRR